MDPSAPLKRFYKAVAVEPVEDGFRVTLDGRELKSPAKRVMPLPTRALAEALAAEWDAQEEHIKPLSMPHMALASTAVDRIGQLRDGVIKQIAKYAESDLICYWTADPEDLAIRQAQAWTPLLEWVEELSGIKLRTQNGIMHIEQPEGTFETFRALVEEYDDWRLAALSNATHCTGSLVIALALLKKHITPQQAFDVSQIDETYQIELWGEDWEAKERREVIQKDLNNITAFMEML